MARDIEAFWVCQKPPNRITFYSDISIMIANKTVEINFLPSYGCNFIDYFVAIDIFKLTLIDFVCTNFD